LFSARQHFRTLTAPVESSDDGMIRRLQLEDFHVFGERVIEVDFARQGDDGRSGGKGAPKAARSDVSTNAEAFTRRRRTSLTFLI
jgi:hypothetical protein